MSISKERYLKYHENFLGQENGVRDVFLEKGMLEIALEGYIWTYQVENERKAIPDGKKHMCKAERCEESLAFRQIE